MKRTSGPPFFILSLKMPKWRMRIQRILDISFLLLLLLTAAPIMLLSFFASKTALETEIGRNLQNDATMLMEQIDMQLFERLQNVHSWSHLDVLQEGRIGDVDKRLAQFLTELAHGYPGVYRQLLFTDPQHQIIAASDSTRIRQNYQPKADWLTTQVPRGAVFLEALQLEPPYQNPELVIRAPVPDSYGGDDIGQLYGMFDLQQLFRLFDQASHAESGERFVLLLDAEGRLIAASDTIRAQNLLLSRQFADWKPAQNHSGISQRDGRPLSESSVLVGYAASKGYQGYTNLGWSLLVIQSTKQAFEPIWSLWALFCGVFVVTGLIAGGVAQWVAGRIARPLLELTAWVHRFQTAPGSIQPTPSGVEEVSELNAAFSQLSDDLEHSRQQVIHAAKLAVVGEMAAIMAHEVRTPLGILQTTAQMLQWENTLSAEAQEMAQMMIEESGRLNRLISTLLDCARPRQPNMQSHDIYKIIQRVLDLLASQANKKSIQITSLLPATAAWIECDEELLVQVFLNLVLNAIQLVPVNGLIEISAGPCEKAIEITIADNGPGIPEANRERLFDPFFTTRDGGIGLGLTVTRQLIALHHGQISAGVSQWGGAQFVLVLPVQQNSSEKA